MEDSHIACTNLDPNVTFFGVFDGHGGNYLKKINRHNMINTILI